MDKPKDETQEVSIPTEETTENGTPSEAPVTVSPDSAENTETQEVAIEDSSPKSQENEKPVKKRNIEAEEGKISALQRRLNEATQQLQAAQVKAQMFDTINQDYSKHPEAYEAWRQARIKATGEDPGSYETLYGQPQQQSSGVSAKGVTDPNTLNRLVDQRVRDVVGWKEFVKKYPRFDPKNIQTEDDRMEIAKEWDVISARAAVLIATDQTLTEDQALEQALLTLPKYKQDAIKQAQETGELIGRANAYATGTGSIGSLSGSQATSTPSQTVRLNKQQMERYNDLKKKNSKLANAYLKNVSNL